MITDIGQFFMQYYPPIPRGQGHRQKLEILCSTFTSKLLCLPPLGLGDILFSPQAPVHLSVCHMSTL